MIKRKEALTEVRLYREYPQNNINPICESKSDFFISVKHSPTDKVVIRIMKVLDRIT